VNVEETPVDTELAEAREIPDGTELADEEISDDTQIKINCPMVKLELLPSNTILSQFETLYEYAEISSLPSQELGTTLFLALNNASFAKQRDSGGCVIEMYGFFGHAIHILPSASMRPPCISLPPEILALIFFEASWRRGSWRKEVLSWALVCRSWEGPALEYLYETFDNNLADYGFQPRLVDLAKTITRNPNLGRMIRVVDFTCFREVLRCSPLEPYIVGSLIETLEAAPLIRNLYIPGIPNDRAIELINAVCKGQNLATLKIRIARFKWELKESAKVFYATPDSGIMAKLFHRIQSLRNVEFWLFTSAEDSEVLSTPPSCSLETLILDNGNIPISHLQLLTSTSLLSLQEVTLKAVVGLSNQDLMNWLFGISGNLVHLDLRQSKFPRQTPDEPFAVETIMPSMAKLESVTLDAGMFSSVILERFNPDPSSKILRTSRTRSLKLNSAEELPISLNTLAKMLPITRWRRIDFIEGADRMLMEEEKREVMAIAERYGIWLYFGFLSSKLVI